MDFTTIHSNGRSLIDTNRENSVTKLSPCKENGPVANLLWILVIDDEHNQIELINLQVIVL